ncbi:hypothetical protein ACHAXS_005773 [Conticribra weissflogii]
MTTSSSWSSSSSPPSPSSSSSPTKSIILATFPKFTSLLSAIGSSLILFKVVRSPKNRSQTMHRLMACLSLADILASSAMFLGTVMIPRGTPSWFGDGTQPIFWAAGTKRTCDASGYLNQLQVGGVLFNASLATYFLLTVYCGWNEVRLRKVEWSFYAIPWGYALVTSTFAAATDLYGHVEWTCWILPTAPLDDALAEPTIVQRNFRWIQWAFLFGVVWLCVLYVSVIFALLHGKMKALERRMNRYSMHRSEIQSRMSREWKASSPPSPSTASQAQAQAIHREERGQLDDDGFASSTERKFELANGAVGSGSVPPGLTTIPSERCRVRSAIDDSQGNDAVAVVVIVDEETAMDPTTFAVSGNDQIASNQHCNDEIHSEVRISENPIAGYERPDVDENDEDDDDDDAATFGINNFSADTRPKQRKIPPKYKTRASVVEITSTIRLPGRRRSTAFMERREAARSKKVAVQGMLYVIAFYITWFFPTMSRITELVAGKNYFAIQFFDTFLIPLQGFFNCAIYLRVSTIHCPERVSCSLPATTTTK